MERLTERIDKVPDGESGIWVKNHDYISAAIKLAEYEDLEEQGRLVELPCAIGDKVYLIVDDKVFEREVDPMFLGVLWEEFNKSWFLTESEAEAKLKKLRGGE